MVFYRLLHVKQTKGSSDDDTYKTLHWLQATLYGSYDLTNLVYDDSNLCIGLLYHRVIHRFDSLKMLVIHRFIHRNMLLIMLFDILEVE